MRLTQGAFSYLPNLTDENVLKLTEYYISQGWSIGVEYTDDPHPRNAYWDLWGLPLFDVKDPAAVLYELKECRAMYPNGYIKIVAFNAARGVESSASSFIVHRPKFEPGFYLERQEVAGRQITYTISSYAVQRNCKGVRYSASDGEEDYYYER
uniref:ribulose-1,5-bisphosphate carboxylase/oxygenase small subunit n=1 Tax=Haramonas pauciplastida TaxID=478668 RepID=UPI0021149FCB|nr:ribulose-1,5-bisphosphate carboxylase/oxygenase small subunit [Haramonas pauciplastida]UTE94941.1 ribulose-1,5-bisphosphate carboxylase/oxygenase small subunit [Haramonas pauciplastida]